MGRALKLWLARGLLVVCASALGLCAAELIAQRLAPLPRDGVEYDSDPQLGWLPRPGRSESTSAEFRTWQAINALGMNDAELDPSQLAAKNRVLVLGDSHTFAVGVSQDQSWPARLERTLFANTAAGTVWNAAVRGYSLDQYLVRFRRLRERLRPTLVLVGFSMATDLYDLGPPSGGGFVYGPDTGRIYFDLDRNGQLAEHDELVGEQLSARELAGRDPRPGTSAALRGFLQDYALYRLAKQSRLALFVASHFHPRGMSLWPGIEAVVARKLDPAAARRWRLAEAILARLADEVRAAGASLVVVDIPYLPQVYDEVWRESFGGMPGYDRFIGGRRLSALCARHAIALLDTTPAFVARVRATQRWLHYRVDRHPTPEGHALIARKVAELLRARALLVP